MTEKTHKFECATITKRITKKLVVLQPQFLFELLPAGLQRKVKFSFPNSDIIKALEMEAIDISTGPENPIAEITETESLAVKKN